MKKSAIGGFNHAIHEVRYANLAGAKGANRLVNKKGRLIFDKPAL
ncbi:MAG: hypothetical protein JWR38_611 [Mucilaginibacter sp.]|nr:hypothetical protein [Mucilaginibacter sp.]